ncbi:sensor domain-containing diguanylate cyclase [Desulfonatronum parangueonense]
MPRDVHLPSPAEIKSVIRFDRRQLPSFPQVALKMLEALGDATTSLHDISRIIETDPGIAARVLEIVNSAGYGTQRTITTLPEAMVVLGEDEIRQLAIGTTIFQGLFASAGSKQFDRIHFWRHSLSVAVLSLEIARKARYPRPEEAYVAGLLHDVGKIFLDLQGHRDYGDFLYQAATGEECLIDQERAALGLGHDDVGAFFCSLWKLPERIVLPVKYHHQQFQTRNFSDEETLLIATVSLADFICWTQGVGSLAGDRIRPPILVPEIEHCIDIEQIGIIDRIMAMNREMERISEFFHFVFPTPGQIHESLIRMNFHLSRANTRLLFPNASHAPHVPHAPDAQGDPEALKKAPGLQQRANRPPLLPDDGFEFGKYLAKAKTFREVMDLIMYRIGVAFEPMHWALLLKDPRSRDLVFSVVEGANKDKLRGTRLAGDQGIAGRILENRASLLVEDLSEDPGLAGGVTTSLGLEPRTCMGTLLRGENNTFGVIELVNKVDGGVYTADELKLLESIADYAAIAMERVHYNQVLHRAATTDALTGLKNRYSLERILCNKDEISRRYGQDMSIMIIDIDDFKQVNRKQGRRAADELLKQVAGLIKTTFRRTDDVFRYEGDKFIALLSGTDKQAADQAKNRMRKSFEALKGETDTSISVFVHSVRTDHSSGLIRFIEERLPQDKAGEACASGETMEESLRPLLDQGARNQEVGRKKVYRKKVMLYGEFTQLQTKQGGIMNVVELAMFEMGFTVPPDQYNIRPGDFLDVSFHLDDRNRSLIERRVMVRGVHGEKIDAEFYNPPPYAKDLGFYLLA